MTRWTVFEPKDSAGRSDRAAFVRDRFSVLAFLFGPLWLLRHRLWLEAAGAVLLFLGFEALGRQEGFAVPASLLQLLLAILVGLEGPERRAARLRRLGWREAGVVTAGDAEEAELRYYAGAATRPAADEAAPAAGSVPRAGPVPAPSPRPSFGGFFAPGAAGGGGTRP